MLPSWQSPSKTGRLQFCCDGLLFINTAVKCTLAEIAGSKPDLKGVQYDNTC